MCVLNGSQVHWTAEVERALQAGGKFSLNLIEINIFDVIF